MVDHGSEDKFYIFSGAFDADRIITPNELGGNLDALQGSLDLDADEQGIVIIYGACHSGSFVPTLAGPKRTIITSSRAEEISHRGAVDPVDNIRDGEVFITEFFRGLRIGQNLKEAFEVASSRITDFTVSRSNSASAESDLPQC
jgi:hypothetical protein